MYGYYVLGSLYVSPFHSLDTMKMLLSRIYKKKMLTYCFQDRFFENYSMKSLKKNLCKIIIFVSSEKRSYENNRVSQILTAHNRSGITTNLSSTLLPLMCKTKNKQNN